MLLVFSLSPEISGWSFLWSALGAVVFGYLRLFAVELPIVWVAQHWRQRPPTWFALGWLPASIVLMFASARVLGFGWPEWVLAALSALVLLWAVVACGPTPSIFHGDGFQLMNSRTVRMVVINLFAVIWLGAVWNGNGGAFTWPFVISVLAAMCAGGVGRNYLLRQFQVLLDSKQQMLWCGILCASSALLGYGLVTLGMSAAWQAPLFVAVLSLLLLRRAMSFQWTATRVRLGYGWFLVLLVVNGLRMVSNSNSLPSMPTPAPDQPIDGSLMFGGLVMLGGVVITCVQRMYRSFRQQRRTA
jgi:hypothetical protein